MLLKTPKGHFEINWPLQKYAQVQIINYRRKYFTLLKVNLKQRKIWAFSTVQTRWSYTLITKEVIHKVTASIWSTKSDLPSYFMNIILLFKNFDKSKERQARISQLYNELAVGGTIDPTTSWNYIWTFYIFFHKKRAEGYISKLSKNSEAVFWNLYPINDSKKRLFKLSFSLVINSWICRNQL